MCAFQPCFFQPTLLTIQKINDDNPGGIWEEVHIFIVEIFSGSDFIDFSGSDPNSIQNKGRPIFGVKIGYLEVMKPTPKKYVPAVFSRQKRPPIYLENFHPREKTDEWFLLKPLMVKPSSVHLLSSRNP